MQVTRCNSLGLNSTKIGFQSLFAPEGRETLTSGPILERESIIFNSQLLRIRLKALRNVMIAAGTVAGFLYLARL